MDKKYIRLPTELFSSISRFVHSSDYFPSSDRRLGLSVRVGYHPDHKRVMVEIEEERPSFVSTIRGEYVEIDEANEKLAQVALELADYCQEVAKELLEHAERLTEISRRDEIIKKSQIEAIARDRGDESREGRLSHTEESRAPVKSKTHARVNHIEPTSLSSANLDLFT